jgi:hypothetical protein
MSANLVTTKPQSTEVATTAEPTANDWVEYARQLDEKPYLGQLLKFAKGQWLLGTGRDAKEVMLGTMATAIVPSCKVGWQNFENGNSIFVPAVHQLKLPSRRALGDNDPATWTLDDAGHEKDPWQFTRTVSLALSGAGSLILCTFTTQSTGGKRAIIKLCKEYGKGISGKEAGKLPVIELGKDSYQHENKTYGRIIIPLLEIVGWENEEKALAILRGDAPEDRNLIEQRPSRAAPRDIIDDDLPAAVYGGPGPGDEEIPWTD